MLNKIKHTAKEGTSKFIKAITVVGTTLLITLSINANPTSADVQKEIKEVFKKNPDKEIVVKVENGQSTDNAAKFEAVQDTTNALDFAVQNVDKYYPDMKEHLINMINQFGRNNERRNAVDSIFNQTIGKITDSKQRIGATIYALEGYIFWESTFGDKYDSDITDETFNIMETAKDQYNTRLENRKKNIAKIQEEIKKIDEELENNKQELENNKQELENILNKITVQDVKAKEGIKNLVIKTKILYTKHNFKTTSHIDELFKLVP